MIWGIIIFWIVIVTASYSASVLLGLVLTFVTFLYIANIFTDRY